MAAKTGNMSVANRTDRIEIQMTKLGFSTTLRDNRCWLN